MNGNDGVKVVEHIVVSSGSAPGLEIAKLAMRSCLQANQYDQALDLYQALRQAGHHIPPDLVESAATALAKVSEN